MYVYLDESGDPGLGLRGRVTSPYFIVSLIIVDDPFPITAALNNLRATLGKPNYEFKFSSTDPATRNGFFATLAKHQFKAFCRVVDKRRIMNHYPHHGSSLYGRLIALMLRDVTDLLVQAKIVIDESFKSRNTKVGFTSMIRRQLSTSVASGLMISDITYANSRSDSLIQVADMIVGAVARTYNKGEDTYMKKIPPRLLTISELLP